MMKNTGGKIVSKTWNVKIDEKSYDITLKGNLLVNGEKIKLNKHIKKRGLIHTDYEVPVGPKTALLIVNSLGAPQLVIDNKDCATGEEYVPVKLPAWAWVFVVLHCVNFINGAIGVGLAVIGIAATTSVSCNRKLNVALRVILDLVILILAFVLLFGVVALIGAML